MAAGTYIGARNTLAQNFNKEIISPISNVRRPISGLVSRGTILNAPSLEDCTPDSNSVQSVSVTAVFGIGVYLVPDILITWQAPVKRIMIASIGPTQAQEVNGIWISLQPSGHTNPGTPFGPSGFENWIQIKSADIGITTFQEGIMVDFAKPITRFYLTLATGAPGTTMNITFADASDIRVYWKPEMSHSG